MPRVEIEIMGETTTTVTERITVVTDVPQEILDGDHLEKWIEEQSQNSSSDVSKQMNEDANVLQEDEVTGFEISSVMYVGPHD